MTIVEFLTARLDEDAAEAKAAPREDGYATHMSCVDPDRILADIAAKRAILAMEPGYSGEYDENDGEAIALARVKAHLASVYADHPDYNPEWRP